RLRSVHASGPYCAGRLEFCVFFFFQAEDGIRDGHVTGVQTCALPIFRGRNRVARVAQALLADLDAEPRRLPSRQRPQRRVGVDRSEERRVGKECRSRGWPYEEKKKERSRRADSKWSESRGAGMGTALY